MRRCIGQYFRASPMAISRPLKLQGGQASHADAIEFSSPTACLLSFFFISRSLPSLFSARPSLSPSQSLPRGCACSETQVCANSHQMMKSFDIEGPLTVPQAPFHCPRSLPCLSLATSDCSAVSPPAPVLGTRRAVTKHSGLLHAHIPLFSTPNPRRRATPGSSSGRRVAP